MAGSGESDQVGVALQLAGREERWVMIYDISIFKQYVTRRSFFIYSKTKEYHCFMIEIRAYYLILQYYSRFLSVNCV